MSTGQVVRPIVDMSAHRRPFVGLPSSSDRNRARRKLFGDVDHEENRRFLQRELGRLSRRDEQKYNFDFAHGVPLPGAFDWVPVDASTERVPPAYSLRRLPFCGSHGADVAASRQQHQEAAAATPSTSGSSRVEGAAAADTPVTSSSSSNSSSITSGSLSTSCSSSSSSSTGSSSGGQDEVGTKAVAVEQTRKSTRQEVMTKYMKQRKRAATVSKVKAPTEATKPKIPKTSSS